MEYGEDEKIVVVYNQNVSDKLYENPLKKKSIRGCYQVNIEGIKSTYFYKTIHLTTLYNVLAHYQNAKVKWIVFKNHIT